MATKKTTIIPEGTFGPLTSKDDVVVIRTKTVVRLLGTTAFIDLSARNTPNHDAHIFLDGLITTVLPKAGYKVKYVQDLATLMRPDERFKDFVERGETSGVDLSEEELAAAKLFTSIREKFVKAFTPPKVPYVRAEIPAGKRTSPLRGISIDTAKDRITRSNYQIRLSDIKGLWENASKRWVSGKRFDSYTTGYVSSHRVWIYPSSIDIGCQRIPRWLFEAVAENQGWDFPSYQPEVK